MVEKGRSRDAESWPRKICLATWAPFVGGAEVAAERLALGLQAAGHDVFLLLGQRGAVLERFDRAGLRCVIEPMQFTDKWRWWKHASSHRRIRAILRREKPDVIHSNDLPTHQPISAAARDLGIPRICHHRFPFGGQAIDWFNKFGAEEHVFVSRALMDEMCSQSSRLAVSPRRVLYDGLPLPPKPDANLRRQARSKLALPLEKTIVTFAGQIIERKGVADLLEAWARLAPELTARCELLIIGDDLQGAGAYRREMEELARRLNSPARFLGFQRNVAEWLLASDMAVVPSHVEPLGNATLEAMAYALPVVGCDVGGIPEMVVDGETGLLVAPRSPEPLAASLLRLIADKELRRLLGEQARGRCEELFSLERHVQAALEIYRSVLERHCDRSALAGAAS
jgi:glycosyltransferase involved in cell wall biosynthesis